MSSRWKMGHLAARARARARVRACCRSDQGLLTCENPGSRVGRWIELLRREPIPHLELDPTVNHSLRQRFAAGDGRREHATPIRQLLVFEAEAHSRLDGGAGGFEITIPADEAALDLMAFLPLCPH